jgi:chromosomal replication initiation ATPase DnaA
MSRGCGDGGGRAAGCGGRREAEAAESACRFIETLVAGAFGVALTDLRAEKRGKAPAAFARQAAMYLAHVHLGLSLSQVGRSFGRDRTTVAHACACVEDSRDDPRVERVIACLEGTLDRWWRGFAMLEAA